MGAIRQADASDRNERPSQAAGCHERFSEWIQSFLPIANEDQVAGIALDTEFAAQCAHALPYRKAGNGS